jgi:hypothetical protein
MFPDASQKSGLARSGLPGQENMPGRLVHKLQGELKIGIREICLRHAAI